MNQSLTSYIHAGDIDYIRFSSGFLPELSLSLQKATVQSGKNQYFITKMSDEDGYFPQAYIDFGDGHTQTISNWTQLVSHAYDYPGRYTATLVAADRYNGQEVQTKTIADVSTKGDVVISCGMAFNYLNSGDFLMGSPTDELGHQSNESQHSVTLTEPYYIMTTEVTQAQWKSVMGSLPAGLIDCPSCPVSRVSWFNVQEFIETLNETYDATFDLPTEAQWEYAARSGSETAFYFGDYTNLYVDANLDIADWYYSNSESCLYEIASKAPNAFGLYDIHGNVSEWCRDSLRSYEEESMTHLALWKNQIKSFAAGHT